MKLHPAFTALLLPALLAACGGSSSTTPGTGTPGTGNGSTGTVGVTAITGKISSSTAGANTVELLADNEQTKSSSNPLLASAALSGSSFSLTLPTPASSLLVSPSSAPSSSCTGSVTSSNASAKGYTLDLLDLTASGSYLQTIDTLQTTQSTSGSTVTISGSQQTWIYITAATTLSGKVACASGTTSVNLTANVPLTAGWNVVNTSLSGQVSSSGSSLNVTAQAGSDGVSTWSTSSQVTAGALAPAGVRSGLRLARSLLPY